MKKLIDAVQSRLIDDWRVAYRKLSIILSALVVAVLEFQDQLPMMQQYLPQDWVKYAVIAIMVARLIKQKSDV